MSENYGEPIPAGQAMGAWDELTLRFDHGFDLGRIARYLRQAWAQLTPEELPITIRVHEEWLEAVAARDVERARALVRQHISVSCDNVVARLATRPDAAAEAAAGGSRAMSRRRQRTP